MMLSQPTDGMDPREYLLPVYQVNSAFPVTTADFARFHYVF